MENWFSGRTTSQPLDVYVSGKQLMYVADTRRHFPIVLPNVESWIYFYVHDNWRQARWENKQLSSLELSTSLTRSMRRRFFIRSRKNHQRTLLEFIVQKSFHGKRSWQGWIFGRGQILSIEYSATTRSRRKYLLEILMCLLCDFCLHNFFLNFFV